MKIKDSVNERNLLRSTWRDIRNARLALKNEMIAMDIHAAEIRHNREYKKLKKEQKILSKMIRHLEKKISGKNES
jgi:hypothetical protein